MSYQIRTYNEGYIQNQFEIGSAIYDPWPMGGQTRPEQLKQTYSADDFDPETRFYAFYENEMVGFLTSALKEKKGGKSYYYFEFPYVKPEHCPNAERALLNYALNALKEKGADVLITRAGEYWGKTLDYAKEYNFTKKEDIVRRGELDLNRVSPSDFGDTTCLVDFDTSQHFEQLIDLYSSTNGTTPDIVEKRLSLWKDKSVGDTITSPWDHINTILTHRLYVSNGEVVGRVLGMNRDNFGDDTINLTQMLYKTGHDDLVETFLAELVRAGQEFGKQTAIIHTGPWGVSPDDDIFTQFGIDFSMKLAFFEREL